jgi:hypothetical protein
MQKNHIARSKVKIKLKGQMQTNGLKQLVRTIILSLAGRTSNHLAQMLNSMKLYVAHD